MLFQMWTDELNDRNVDTKMELSIIEYLSVPSQRLDWKAHHLPDDDLCFENAIMMNRFNRYPLIIDPSGQAISFLMEFFNNNKNSRRKMIRTSFLDPGFLQSIDPILNSVLNREIFKSGGRVMITVGAKEIDFSPHFTIYLCTRDPTCHFTPDLCSRVTFVNFTATHASLAAQCLNKVLKSERPEIDQERTDLLKLQGEFKVQLRTLERQLLEALNSVKTNILEDDKVMITLETLKKKATEVNEKMENSELVMARVTETASVYEPFSRLSSKIYFTLEELSTSHFLYQFSLPFFLQLVDDVLDEKTNSALASLSKEDEKITQKVYLERLEVIRTTLFDFTFLRTGRGLLQKDLVPFALRLAQCSLSEKSASGTLPLDLNEVEFLLKVESSALGYGAPGLPKGLKLNKDQASMLGKLSKLPAFSNLINHLNSNTDAWQEVVEGRNTSSDPEKDEEKESEGVESVTFPKGWELSTENGSIHQSSFRKLLLSRVFRPELMDTAAKEFVASIFGKEFFNQVEDPHLDQLVRVETRPGTPLLLVTFPGYDASVRVMNLARTMVMDGKCTALAMGSPEGFSQADTAINVAAKRGHWVLLKNVHLAPSWLSSLEKRIHRIEPNQNFRVFMTMEVNPRVPANLVRMSNVVIFEPPRGLKSSMVRIFNALPQQRVDRAPAERSRLYFLLAWLHSVILERLRYAPVGWTKTFEFSEADQRCAMDAIDEWVDKTSAGRLNVRPEMLPWDAIQTSLEKIIYGGRIDNPYDQARLSAFVKHLFSPRSYDKDFALAGGHDEKGEFVPFVKIPDCHNYNGFHSWIVNELKDISSPKFLGLPEDTNLLLQKEQTLNILKVFGKLQAADKDVERANILKRKIPDSHKRRHSITSGQPPWWKRVSTLVGRWMKSIPSKVERLSGEASNALVRALQREISMYSKVHQRVFFDLISANEVFELKAIANNATRAVMNAIGEHDTVPKAWNIRSPGSETMSPSPWMQDFIRRIQCINTIAKTPIQNLGSKPIWLGGLLSPEAFVAASRQEVARTKKCPLDSLILKVTISNSAAPLTDDFIFQGLTIHGAECHQSMLTISDKVMQELPYSHFQWLNLSEFKEDDSNLVTIPVYLTQNRRQFLFEIRLPYDSKYNESVFRKRGTCLTVW